MPTKKAMDIRPGDVILRERDEARLDVLKNETLPHGRVKISFTYFDPSDSKVGLSYMIHRNSTKLFTLFNRNN